MLRDSSNKEVAVINEKPYLPSSTDPALEAILSGRSEILQTQLSVAAVQIVERLRIRSQNLERILEEELQVGSRLIPFEGKYLGQTPDLMGLESVLIGKQSELAKERRQQDTECWRDLIQVMRDLMSAWEGWSGQQAKQRFLNSIPKPADNHEQPYTEKPNQNDDQNNPYYPR